VILTADRYLDLRQAVDRPDEAIDLGRAALAVAASDYPDLDIARYLLQIDELAVAASARLAGDWNVDQAIAALNGVLFREHGFRGNREDYFDPKNSFLNEVLDRKTGIPISLSVLYMEVGQRIGLSLQGIGFPGHFLVKYLGANEEVVIDPFNQGEIRSRQSLESMVYRLYEGKIRFDPSFLEPVTKTQILKRMLNNLRMIYSRGNDFLQLLSVTERLVVLDPASAEDIRDRGAVYLKLECFKQALEDFQTYLRLAPLADDASAVREQVDSLTRRVAQIH
jgi:regulator of sirC expression with transglutaminase-like and TPR domain